MPKVSVVPFSQNFAVSTQNFSMRYQQKLLTLKFLDLQYILLKFFFFFFALINAMPFITNREFPGIVYTCLFS